MKTSKILGFILIVVNLGSIVLFAVTAHTIISVLAFSSPTGSDSPIILDPVTGLGKVSFEMQPRNDGFLESEVTVGIRIVTAEESLWAGNSTSFRLAAGTGRRVTLTLKVPLDRLRLYSEGKGSLEIETGVTTLGGMAHMDYKVRLKGGVQQ